MTDNGIRLYFPAVVLMQYVDASSISELSEKLRDNKIAVLGTLLKRDDQEDVHTTIIMPAILKKYFRALRNKMTKKILGKDIILFFRREVPIEIEAEEEYELLLQLNPQVANKLRIRKFSVAERFLATDIIFRLYYYMYDKFKDKIKEIKELESKVITFSQSARYELLLSNYTPFEFPVHKMIMNIHYPSMVDGFISSNFQLLTKSGVFQLALLYHARERKFEDFFDSGRLPGIENTEVFVQECKYHFDRSIEHYSHTLDRFISELRAIVEEKDVIEEFIKSCLPATFFTIYEKAKAQGFDVDEVMFKLRDLIRRGVVKLDGEVLK